MTENDKSVLEVNINNLEKQLNGVFPKSFSFVKCKVVKKLPKWLKYGHRDRPVEIYQSDKIFQINT